MKKIIKSALVICSIFCASGVIAQKGEQVTPYNISITFSDEIYSLVAPNATLSNITDGYSDVAQVIMDGEIKENNPAGYFDYMARTNIAEHGLNTFKETLDIEVKPLNTLEGKVEFNGTYPSEARLKRALQQAPGEELYFSFEVYLFEGGVSVGPAALDMGGKLKPTIAIGLVIANDKGKVLQEVKVKEKSDFSIGKKKTAVGNIEVGEGMNPDLLVENVMKVYSEAMDVFVKAYLKENKQQYKS